MATPKKPQSVKIYLTDWQKRMIKDVYKRRCEFIELPIVAGRILMYIVCPNDIPKGPRLYLTDEQILTLRAAGKRLTFLELPWGSDPMPMYGVPPDPVPMYGVPSSRRRPR
jgi:hypothetical protein